MRSYYITWRERVAVFLFRTFISVLFIVNLLWAGVKSHLMHMSSLRFDKQNMTKGSRWLNSLLLSTYPWEERQEEHT